MLDIVRDQRKTDGRFRPARVKTEQTADLKSFGRRKAYESRRGTNPRAARKVYGDFGFWPALERARGLAERVSVDTDRRHRRVIKLVRGREWRFAVIARALTGVDSASDIAAGTAGTAGRGDAKP
jgi:hypothetical protein